MTTPSRRTLCVGDHVRFSESTSAHVTGVVVELLQGDYVRVRWPDLPGTTTHRAHGLSIVPMDRTIGVEDTTEIRCLTGPESKSEG